jgi:hypothetical protein
VRYILLSVLTTILRITSIGVAFFAVGSTLALLNKSRNWRAGEDARLRSATAALIVTLAGLALGIGGMLSDPVATEAAQRAYSEAFAFLGDLASIAGMSLLFFWDMPCSA